MSRRNHPRRYGRSSSAPRTAAVAALTLAVAASAPTARAIVAFPGAEGFGANAVGGRNGDVYHVTTLVDDPNHLTPGSLFYGLYEKNVPGSGTVPGNGRTIVFDVGGTIHLGATTLDLKNIKNVTIAGQTAPGGITIVGNTVQVTSSSGKETSNIILQHVALRKGPENGNADSLSIKGSGDTHDIIVDHVSGSWSEDEVISVAGATNHAENVTVQNSTMSEALENGHQYGALIRNNQSAHVSYLHNLFSDNSSRNPRPGTYLGTQLNFEFQNNVIYNFSDRAGYTGGASESDTENVNMNYVGNYVIAGPSTVGGPTAPGDSPVVGARRNTAFTKDASNDPLNLHVYQSGNKVDWGSSVADPSRHGQDIGWTAFANWNGTTSSPFPATDQNAAPFPYPAVADSADVAYGKVIASVGAHPYARDATDNRLVNQVLSYTGQAALVETNNTMPATQNAEYQALLAAPVMTRPANWDTDHDGMPNDWETIHGFNPSVDDHLTFAADGYTRLEHYLQSLSAIANWGVNSSGNWSDYLNWRGVRPETRDSTANFGATITAPRVINVDIPASVGQLSFASDQPYTLSGVSTLTMDVFAGSATINVTAGSHGITTPVTLADNTIITSAVGSGVTITDLQPAPTVTLTKNGGGGLAVNNVRAAALTINDGVVLLIPDGSASGVSKVTSLSMPGSTSQLDLARNKLITGTSVPAVTALIQSGRAGGAWTGHGIVSSDAAGSGGLTSIGVATGAQVKGVAATGTATWAGQTVSGSDTLVMYTYAGDANLDGKINVDDYGHIDSSVVLPGVSGWFNGDFNYDGKINVDDYGIIDSNVTIQGAPIFTGAGAGLNGVTAIPEPAGATVLITSAAALAGPVLRRRRRAISGRTR
jgi:hypothetical protein